MTQVLTQEDQAWWLVSACSPRQWVLALVFGPSAASGRSKANDGKLKEAVDCKNELDAFSTSHAARVVAAKPKSLSAADRMKQLRESAVAKQGASAASRGGACLRKWRCLRVFGH